VFGAAHPEWEVRRGEDRSDRIRGEGVGVAVSRSQLITSACPRLGPLGRSRLTERLRVSSSPFRPQAGERVMIREAGRAESGREFD